MQKALAQPLNLLRIGELYKCAKLVETLD